MELTPEQITFLRQHDIPLGSLFDAKGFKGAALKELMEQHEKLFAYNATRCGKGGHTMRSRSGHCIQCSPAAISFLRRYFANQHVYVAQSERGGLIKVGTTDDVPRRQWQLNSWEYGRQSDWQIVTTARTDNAGRVEGDAHRRLARYRVRGDYVRAGRRQQCLELFNCSLSDAKDALQQALKETALQF